MLTNLLSNAIKFTQEGSIVTTVDIMNLAESSNPTSEAANQSTIPGQDDQYNDRTAQYLMFKVSDTGMGVPESKRLLLFRAFGQANNKSGGTGLGLFGVKTKAEALGGGVGFETQDSVGSIFWFCVPYRPCTNEAVVQEHITKKGRRRSVRSPGSESSSIPPSSVGSDALQISESKKSDSSIIHSPHQADEVTTNLNIDTKLNRTSHVPILKLEELTAGIRSPQRVPATSTAHSSAGSSRWATGTMTTAVSSVQTAAAGLQPSKGYLLVVEDEGSIRKMFSRRLEREGYVVDQAVHGAEGLELMKSREYDAVFCDMNMPVMDGYEAVKKFRNWEMKMMQTGERSLKQLIFAVSASSDPLDQRRAITAGVDKFLQKPVSTSVMLLEMIQKKQALEDENDEFNDNDDEEPSEDVDPRSTRMSSIEAML